MMPEPHLHIPVLIPGLLYHYEVHVHSVHENGAAGIIRIYVCNKVRIARVVLPGAVCHLPLSASLRLMVGRCGSL